MNVLIEENNMSGTVDPVRLRRMVARGSMLERGLEAAQSSGPTDDELQALELRVLAGLGATAAATAAVTVAKTAGSQGAVAAAGWLSAGSAKLVVALVATVTLGGGSVAIWHAANPGASSRAAVAKPARGSASTSGQRPERPTAAQNPALVSATPTPTQVALPLPAGTGAAPAHALLALQPRVAGSMQSDLAIISGSKPRLARSAQEPGLAPPPAAVTFRKVAASRAGSAESARETSDEELSLLARANRALAKSPALALTLSDEHTRRFPDSGMDQEREIIAITALVELGQTAEARRRATRFSRAHSGSVYQSRIEKALAPR